MRYNADGSLDAGFDGDGIAVTSIGNFQDYSSDIAVQSDGKIVAVGYTQIGNGSSIDYNFAVARYNADGSLDASFDGDGIVITNPLGNTDFLFSVAIQSNGKVVAAGSRGGDGNKFFDAVLVRYNPNGSLDASFGNGGIQINTFGLISFFSTIALQPDGKIVASGEVDGNVLIARYIGDAVISNRRLFDFDGDGRADISVFRPSDRIWYLLRSQSGFTAAQFGISTDRITPADFDGDGKTDIAVFRDGVWYWLNSSNGSFNAFQFGVAGDIPIPADYTGDGRAELAVYRAGIWYTWNLANNQFNAVQFGISTDKPVPADFDGDGKTDIAVYRDGIWYLLRSQQGFGAVQFGVANDKPISAAFVP